MAIELNYYILGGWRPNTLGLPDHVWGREDMCTLVQVFGMSFEVDEAPFWAALADYFLIGGAEV